MPNIRVKIDVTKILKEHLFKGEKGTYLDITLLENRNGVDQYGNHYMVVQDVGKEAREKGEKGPILGNGKEFGAKTPAAAPKTAARAANPPLAAGLDEDVPF